MILAQPAIHASVDVFSSDLDCQASQEASFSNGYGGASFPDCSVSWTSEEQQVDGGDILLMQNASCATNEISPQDESAQRFLICAMDSIMVQNPAGDEGGDFGEAGAGPLATIEATSITCLICLPTYSIATANITMIGQNVTGVSFPPDAQSRQIPGLSPWQMGMSVFHSFGVISAPNFLGQTDGDDGLIWGNDPFLSLLQNTNPATSNFTTLFDADTLQNASRKTFQRLGAQVALLNFMSSANASIVRVNYESLESRLCVGSSIFFVMELILCALIIDAVLLAFLATRLRVISRDPGTILGLAAIMARSPSLVSMLSGTAHTSMSNLQNRLAVAKFRTTGLDDSTSQPFRIDAQSTGVEQRNEALDKPSGSIRAEVISWVPFATTSKGYILLCVIPIVVVALLLGLLTRSKSTQGITNLPPDLVYVHYGWTLFPATLFFGISIPFGMLDNSIRNIQPFYELSRGPSDRERGKYIKDYSGLLPLQNLWYAVRYRHPALIASTIATFCGFFFPIVISGLYRYVYFVLTYSIHPRKDGLQPHSIYWC